MLPMSFFGIGKGTEPLKKQVEQQIEKAKEESINTILQQVELKKRGKLDKVYVTGCLSERYKNNLEEEIPEVDAFFGTMELQGMLKQFNADYKNDTFKIFVTGAKEYELIIFDSFGKQVFYSLDYDESWDGNYEDASQAPQGLYTYKATIKKINDIGYYKESGSINLIR